MSDNLKISMPIDPDRFSDKSHTTALADQFTHQQTLVAYAELEALETEAASDLQRATGNARADAERHLYKVQDAMMIAKNVQVEHLKRGLADGTYQLSNGVPDDSHLFNDSTNTPDPFRGIDPYARQGETRRQALTAIERWNADDKVKEGATETLERLEGDDVDPVSEFVLRTSHPLYVAAYRKYVANPDGFGAELSADERRAWSSVGTYARAALQLSGAVVPAPLDPSIVISNSGVVDPMRGVARVDTTTSSTKTYVTSAGVSASFDAELAETSDDTPTLTGPVITVRKAQAFVQASVEAWQDSIGFDYEIVKLFADAKATLEGSMFVNGAAGSNQPIGIITALTGGASEINAAGELLAAADVYGLIEALPARWRQNAKWQAELSTLNFMDQFETTNGAKLFANLGDANPMLLRRAVVENSSVDPYSAVDAAATANNYVLLVGDFQQYAILDRVGLSISWLQPGVLQNVTTNLPDGRMGAYGFWRVGADSLVDSAFRMLDVATTA